LGLTGLVPVRPAPAAGAKMARSVLSATVVLLILGLAGSFIVITIQDPRWQTAAGAAAEKAATGSGASASVPIATPLFLFPGKGGAAPAFVALADPVADVERHSLSRTRQSLLARELVRQAFLVAARDELGMATRDAVLGDWRASDGQGNDPTAELVIQFQPGGSSRAWVRQTGQSAGTTLLEINLTDVVASLTESTPDNLAKLVEIAETLSRNEFRAALRTLGAEGQANALRPDAPVPAGVEERLFRLGYTESFQALRLLHVANRTDGESAARLGALVRGYALLGILTEFHWHPAHEVFKARSLLYAQRLVARDPASSWGRWHRAFAATLAGLHKDALADLALAKSRAAAEGRSATPGWAGLIEAAAAGDAGKLKVESGPLAPLAALLRMSEIELEGAPSLLLHAAGLVVTIDPECCRAIDAMCGVPTLNNLHRVTLVGPQALEQTLPTRLKAIADLPKGVAARLDKTEFGAPNLAESLLAAGDRTADLGEPSWGVLGQLIRETTFVQVYRRLSFMKAIGSAPVDEFWSLARPAVADHPYRQFLELFVLPQREAAQVYGKLSQQLNLTNVGVSELDMLRRGDGGTNAEMNTIRTAVVSHIDHVVRDLSLFMTKDPPAAQIDRARLARLFLAVSPRSPCARAMSIAYDWAAVKLRVPEWQNEVVRSPALLAALGRREKSLNEVGEAERYLNQYIKLSPDPWAYEMLAGIYKSQNDTKRWLGMLEEFLKRADDPAVDQARIQEQIADHYMSQGEWAKARPYANAAGATWARSAMTSAWRCAEEMKDWQNAELWARRITERYPESSWDEWFLFCKRTGHGDVESARAFAERYVAAVSDRARIANSQDLGFYYWLGGNPKKALESFRGAFESRNVMESGFYGVLVADVLGDTATRDELYKSFVKKHRRDAPRTIQIWEILRNAAEKTPTQPRDMKPIDQIVNGLSDQSRWHMQFLVGEYLKAHGMDNLARSYIERCAKSPYATKWFTALACDQVREIDKTATSPKAKASLAR